jgi:hypothetical protein
MLDLCRLIFGIASDLLRSQVALEAEILVLRQQINVLRRANPYPSAEYRLPASLHFGESDAIGGVVRARSVHKVGYGHNCDWAAA